MTVIQRIACASLVFASFGGAPSWAAEVSRDFALGVNEANATLRGGDVDSALEKYASVQELAPESADLAYNMAVAQYRKGDIAAAEQLFQSAASSENDSLAANARYNLGNCNYASGLELSQKDRPAAISQLESAIENYRSALDVDGSNADARANIELASRLIDQLREEQQQQEEQQQNQQNQQQDQQQESSDQQQNNQQQNSQDQQQQDQQQSEQQQEEQQGSQSSQGDEQQEQQDQQQSGSDQQQQENENQQQQEELQSQQDKPQSDESKSDESQSDQTKSEEQQQESQSESQQREEGQPQDQQQQNQQSKQQRPQQQQPQDASAADEADEKESEQPPQGELTTATEDEAREGEDQKQVTMFDPSKDGEMTQQEAEKMLQAIRDRDMARRMQRRQDELRRHVPVDRDW